MRHRQPGVHARGGASGAPACCVVGCAEERPSLPGRASSTHCISSYRNSCGLGEAAGGKTSNFPHGLHQISNSWRQARCRGLDEAAPPSPSRHPAGILAASQLGVISPPACHFQPAQPLAACNTCSLRPYWRRGHAVFFVTLVAGSAVPSATLCFRHLCNSSHGTVSEWQIQVDEYG